MKKMLALLLTAILAAMLACCPVSAEDSVPQPEGGKKFESFWAIPGGLVQIDYEEVGYRVYIDLQRPGENGGAVWEYSCYYNEEKDILESVSSMKYSYSFDPDTFERKDGDNEYEGLDAEDGKCTEFSVNENGLLLWADGREDAGAGLAFSDIGRFEGVWRNEAEDVWADITWNGLTEDDMFYTVYIHRGGEKQYTEFLMNGFYNPESGKLECMGTATAFTVDADGVLNASDDDETYEAFFSALGGGKILFEAANGIELTYDLMGR